MEEAKEWLETAKRDLTTAKYNMKGGLFDVVAFYSHQTAEKALKAVYIRLCERLNPHYIATRYPVSAEYRKTDAKQALRFSQEVLEWSKKAILSGS